MISRYSFPSATNSSGTRPLRSALHSTPRPERSTETGEDPTDPSPGESPSISASSASSSSTLWPSKPTNSALSRVLMARPKFCAVVLQLSSSPREHSTIATPCLDSTTSARRSSAGNHPQHVIRSWLHKGSKELPLQHDQVLPLINQCMIHPGLPAHLQAGCCDGSILGERRAPAHVYFRPARLDHRLQSPPLGAVQCHLSPASGIDDFVGVREFSRLLTLPEKFASLAFPLDSETWARHA